MPSDLLEPEAPETPRPSNASNPEPPPTPAPAEPYNSSASGDELTAYLAQPRPDPLLGEFIETDDLDLKRLGSGPDSSLAIKALGLSTDAVSARRGANAGAVAEVSAELEEVEDEAPERSGPGWSTILLASYASAVTIALAWVLWTGRHLPAPPAAESDAPAAEAVEPADPGLRAGRSRRIAAPAPLPEDRITSLGKPLRVGRVEVTADSVEVGPVVLERIVTGHSFQQKGRDALKLHLRIKNISTDTVLAPMDESFLRQKVGERADSFVETSPGDPPILLYPLATESEWMIVGQEFRDLMPGETLETVVVTQAGAAKPMPETMTWRIRLRTDIAQTEEIGIRVSGSEARREVPEIKTPSGSR